MKKAGITLLLALCLLLCACGHGEEMPVTPSPAPTAEPVTPAPESHTPEELIRTMVLDYGFYPDSSDLQVAALLSELYGLDPEAGEKWTEIMDFWAYTRDGLQVNSGALPTDLPRDDSLCIVVLGYQLAPDGDMRPELLSRCELALSCAEQYPEAYILCTGGGTAVLAPQLTEAGQMARWLAEQGVAADRLLVEDYSRTTGQNAMYSHNLLRSLPRVRQVAIVSSDYHIPWGTLLFEAEFILSGGEERLTVVSNAGCSVPNHEDYPLSFQGAGLLELAGFGADAMDIYYGRMKTPELK